MKSSADGFLGGSMSLSERQKHILDFFCRFVQENNRLPTIREVGAATNIASTSVVSFNLEILQKLGLLRREDVQQCICQNNLGQRSRTCAKLSTQIPLFRPRMGGKAT